MALFGKITQLLKSFQNSSVENSPGNQNLFNTKEKNADPTASAEIAELILSNLGQQFAARNAQFINADGKPDGKAATSSPCIRPS